MLQFAEITVSEKPASQACRNVPPGLRIELARGCEVKPIVQPEHGSLHSRDN